MQMNTQIQTKEEEALDGRQVKALTILSTTELTNVANGLAAPNSVIGGRTVPEQMLTLWAVDLVGCTDVNWAFSSAGRRFGDVHVHRASSLGASDC